MWRLCPRRRATPATRGAGHRRVVEIRRWRQRLRHRRLWLQPGRRGTGRCLIGIGEDAEQDGILAFEVVRDLPGGGPDVLGDASHGGRLEAFGGDECPGGVDNLTALGIVIDDQRHSLIIRYITTVV